MVFTLTQNFQCVRSICHELLVGCKSYGAFGYIKGGHGVFEWHEGLVSRPREEFFLNETWASVVFGLDGELFGWMNSVPLIPFFEGASDYPAPYIWSWILGCDIQILFDEI